MIEISNTSPSPRVEEAVLFPFDSHSVPFSSGLRLQMVSGKGYGRKAPIVLKRSQGSAPDDETVRFYGTVVPFEDELRIWYPARGKLDARTGVYRLCHATSRDGRNWEKPPLGLVPYDGSRANNAAELFDGACDLVCGPIIFDPQDTDPDRRFKGAFWTRRYRGKVAVAYSPDGLRWTESASNPRGQYIEPSGLIRHHGCYYLNGHGGVHFGPVRNLVTYASYDFEYWTAATCLGYQRDREPSSASLSVAKFRSSAGRGDNPSGSARRHRIDSPSTSTANSLALTVMFGSLAFEPPGRHPVSFKNQSAWSMACRSSGSGTRRCSSLTPCGQPASGTNAGGATTAAAAKQVVGLSTCGP